MNHHTLRTKNTINDSNIDILDDTLSIKHTYMDDDADNEIIIKDNYNIDFYL